MRTTNGIDFWETPPFTPPVMSTSEQRALDELYFKTPAGHADNIAYDWIRAALGDQELPRHRRILLARQTCSQHAFHRECVAEWFKSAHADVPLLFGGKAREKNWRMVMHALDELAWLRRVLMLLDEMAREPSAEPAVATGS